MERQEGRRFHRMVAAIGKTGKQFVEMSIKSFPEFPQRIALDADAASGGSSKTTGTSTAARRAEPNFVDISLPAERRAAKIPGIMQRPSSWMLVTSSHDRCPDEI